MHYSCRILQDLTKNYKQKILTHKAFLSRFLPDSYEKYVFCRILGRLTSSVRILEEISFSARIFEDSYFLQESERILQDMYSCSPRVTPTFLGIESTAVLCINIYCCQR